MPELPDVAALKKYFDSTALHQTIAHTRVVDNRILDGISPGKLANRLTGEAFAETSRHGKFLFARAGERGWLVLHFGMTGDLKYERADGGMPEYARMAAEFDKGYRLAYICKRMLGRVAFTEDTRAFIEEQDLGPDALEPGIDRAAFKKLLAGSDAAIKSLLMDQSKIAGIGNVYSDEILYQARIHPATKSGSLHKDQINKLYRTMRRVLAVAAGHNAEVDRYPRRYLLHERGDEGNCPACGQPLQKAGINSRTAYFCPICQKAPSPD